MPEVDPKALSLVEEGLALYSAGRLEEALGKWEQALAIDPTVPRATEYSQYVRENREALGSPAEAQPDSTSAEPAASPEPVDEPASIDLDLDGFTLDEPPGEDGVPGLDFTPAAADDLTPRVNLRSIDGILGDGILGDGLVGDGGAEARAPADADDITQRVLLDDYEDEIARSRERLQELQRAERELAGTDDRALKLVPGAARGAPSGDDFEPAELTPVGIKLPEPSRLVAEGELGLTPDLGPGLTLDELPPDELPPPLDDLPDDDELDEELMRGQATPARLGKGSDRFDERELQPTPLRVEPISGLAGSGAVGAQLSGSGSDDLLAGLGEMLPESEMRPAGGAPPAKDPNDFVLQAPTAKRPAAALDELAASVAVGSGALEPATGSQDAEAMLAGARQLFEQGTHEGSLLLCERILEAEPNHDAASSLLRRNEEALLGQFEARLGDLEVVPVVQVPQHEIVWHKLDHRAGFLLSRVDGMLTYDEILDVSGMGRFETCRILSQLIEQGVIAARGK